MRVQDILLELPCEDVDQVMLFGNIQVTTQALQQLLKNGIEMAIFTFTGKLLGQVTPPKTKNIHLRIAQFERYRDKSFTLQIAKEIVQAKLHNALTILRKHRKNHPELFTIEEIENFNRFIERTKVAENTAELRGVEGSATAVYFRLFGLMFNPPWKFNKRTRRPPKDPVNAVLSYGYVIVGAEIQSLLDGIGFDPYLGFYHAVHYGRPSLALDLLEEFRHPLVDRLALNLFNLNILQEDDFYKPPKGGVYLNISGKKKFFKQYEKILGEYASDTDAAEKAKSYRAIFQKQIQKFAKALQGEINYKSFYLE